MNFAALPFFEAFITELKKHLNARTFAQLQLNDALIVINNIQRNISLLTDTVSDATRDRIYSYFFPFLALSIKDANLQTLLEPLCCVSSDFIKPLFTQAFLKINQGILIILKEFKKI